MADLSKQLGKRIKQIRKAAKLTQERLAEKAGLSVEYISRLERGVSQPSLKTLALIAKSLNIAVKDFFDFKMPVLFRDRQQESLKRKEYTEGILRELTEMDIHVLAIASNIIRVLAGR